MTDPLARRLRDAAAFRLPDPRSRRVELTITEQGVRVDVSLYGVRRIGTVVPWDRVTDDEVSPLPRAIERCSMELDIRGSAHAQ